MVVLVAWGEQGSQALPTAGGDDFSRLYRLDAACAQSLRKIGSQLGVATHLAAHLFLYPVQTADVVFVAVGHQYRRHSRPPQLGVVVQYLASPGPVRLSRIDHHHVVVGVADEVYLRPTGVHRAEGVGVFQDVSAVDVVGDLHVFPLCDGGVSNF